MQLRFRGGKGVATGLGALLAFDSLIVLVLMLVLLPVWAVFRRLTLSGMVSLALSPLAVFFCKLGNVQVAAVSFVAIPILFAHRRNLRDELRRLHSERVAKRNPEPRDKGVGS